MQSYQQWIWQRAGWPHFIYDINLLLPGLTALSRLIGALEATSLALASDLVLDTEVRVLAEDAVETSAIEGEVLRRSSVRASVRKQLGLPLDHDDSDMRTNALVAMLLDARQRADQPLTEERLCGWHSALFPTGYSGLLRIAVGRYRSGEMQIVSGPIGREKVHYVAPPADILTHEVHNFLDWVNSAEPIEPLLKAGIAHLWFIMIHPFDDGNGRIGRAVTDYLLSGSSPRLMQVISFSKQASLDRKGYYRVLEEAGKGELDISGWLLWFLQTLTAAVKDSQWIIEQVVRKTIFWQLHKNTPLNARQSKVINRLFDAGDKFAGGMTTRKYASITKCSKVTASRDLADLEKKGILGKAGGGGRSTSYEIRIAGPT